MAIGDQQDVSDRLWGVVPRRWFGDSQPQAPVSVAALQAPAWALSFTYGLAAFARQQARIATATGGWIDLTLYDFFSPNLPRGATETDDQYRLRGRREVFRDRNTRNAYDRAVFDLTGNHPRIFEGFEPIDTGAWDVSVTGWDVAGAWGEDGVNGDGVVLIDVLNPTGYGLPNAPGWDSTDGGYDFAPFHFEEDAASTGSGPTILDILAAIERVRTAGIRVWVRFVDAFDPGVHLGV